jgi:hypothetical protein
MEKLKKYLQYPAIILLIILLIVYGVFQYVSILVSAQENNSDMYLS